MVNLPLEIPFLIATIILSTSIDKGYGQPQIDTFKEKPEKCYDTDDLAQRRCCIFPPFFDQLSARACGALLYHISTDDQFNVTYVRRDMFGRSDYWRCLLTKYNLLDEEDKVIHDKYYKHLDKWATLNSDFVNVLTAAKMFCLNMHKYEMPLEISGFFEFQNCIRNYVNLDCPVIVQSKECFEWKEFYEECREFYI